MWHLVRFILTSLTQTSMPGDGTVLPEIPCRLINHAESAKVPVLFGKAMTVFITNMTEKTVSRDVIPCVTEDDVRLNAVVFRIAELNANNR